MKKRTLKASNVHFTLNPEKVWQTQAVQAQFYWDAA